MAGQVHRALTLLASALPTPLINKVTERSVKYILSLGFDAMVVVTKSIFGEFHNVIDINLNDIEFSIFLLR